MSAKIFIKLVWLLFSPFLVNQINWHNQKILICQSCLSSFSWCRCFCLSNQLSILFSVSHRKKKWSQTLTLQKEEREFPNKIKTIPIFCFLDFFFMINDKKVLIYDIFLRYFEGLFFFNLSNLAKHLHVLFINNKSFEKSECKWKCWKIIKKRKQKLCLGYLVLY